MMGLSNSSLHDAAAQGRAKKLQRLLKKDASNVNKMHMNETPLLHAVRAKSIALVSILLKYDADPNLLCCVCINKTRPSDSQAYDWTAVHEAAKNGDSEMMDLLLSHGGDKNLQFEQARQLLPPLHIAAWHNKADTAKTLINAGCDVNLLDFYCESALVIPICRGHTEMVELLLNSGCKLNSRAWGNLRKIWQGRKRERKEGLFQRGGPYSLLSLSILRSWPHMAVLLLQHGYDCSRCEIYALVKALKFSEYGLGEMAQRVIACYMAAGYTPRLGDTQLLDNLQLPPNQGFDTDLLTWIKTHIGMHSLQHLCRNRIRSVLRRATENASIMSRIKQLAAFLPLCLVEYLALAEFTIADSDSYRQLPLALLSDDLVYLYLSTS